MGMQYSVDTGTVLELKTKYRRKNRIWVPSDTVWLQNVMFKFKKQNFKCSWGSLRGHMTSIL